MSEFILFGTLGVFALFILGGAIFLAYFLLKYVVWPALRVLYVLFRHPPKPPAHFGFWLSAFVLAYFLYPALSTDFSVAGARVRANHDVLALNVLNRTLFWIVLAAPNVPLLLLQRTHSNRNNPWLGMAWHLWKVLFIVFAGATVLVISAAVVPAWGAWYVKIFSTLWFWWHAGAAYLEADSARTAAELAQPAFRYGKIWLKDLSAMLLAFVPFLFFYRVLLLHKADDKEKGTAHSVKYPPDIPQ